MRNLRTFACVIAALGAIAVAGCDDDDTEAELHVDNQSDFAIVELHVTPVGSTTWGPNLIAGDTLLPGESLFLDVSCDFYDVLLIDEAGVDCELHDLDLCLNHADWVIRNETCAVFGAAKAAREAAKSTAPTAKSAAPATPGATAH